jgi:hypothetical protein
MHACTCTCTRMHACTRLGPAWGLQLCMCVLAAPAGGQRRAARGRGRADVPGWVGVTCCDALKRYMCFVNMVCVWRGDEVRATYRGGHMLGLGWVLGLSWLGGWGGSARPPSQPTTQATHPPTNQPLRPLPSPPGLQAEGGCAPGRGHRRLGGQPGRGLARGRRHRLHGQVSGAGPTVLYRLNEEFFFKLFKLEGKAEPGDVDGWTALGLMSGHVGT